MLIDLLPIKDRPCALFDVVRPKSAQLMSALDAVNDRFGKKTMLVGFGGMKRAWSLRADHRSPHYTTRIADLPGVR